MSEYNKKDMRKFKPTVGMGTDVKNTQMLGGKGAMTPAQNETNETVPHTTGAAPKCTPYGGENQH